MVRRVSFKAHKHGPLVHAHDHVHVTHYLHVERGEIEHFMCNHRHRHNHTGVEHAHLRHENVEREHRREAHIHDHGHPTE